LESLRREVGRLREVERACEVLWGECEEGERTANYLRAELEGLCAVRDVYVSLKKTVKGKDGRLKEVEGQLDVERKRREEEARERGKNEEVLKAENKAIMEEVVRLKREAGKVGSLEGVIREMDIKMRQVRYGALYPKP
jgi:hypothetical protein